MANEEDYIHILHFRSFVIVFKKGGLPLVSSFTEVPLFKTQWASLPPCQKELMTDLWQINLMFGLAGLAQ